MSEFYDFCRDQSWLALILICATYYTIKGAFRYVRVALRGWPPAHLDADGDFKSSEKS